MDDVWKPSGAPEPEFDRGPVDLGRARYGAGLPVSEAFSPPLVFQIGLQVMREAPTLFAVAGGAMWVAEVLSSLPFIGAGLMILAMAPQDGSEVEIRDPVVIWGLIGMFLAGRALQSWVCGGAKVAFANWIRNDRANPLAVVASVWPSTCHVLFEAGFNLVLGVGTLFLGFLVCGASCCMAPFASSAESAVVLMLLVLLAWGGLSLYLGSGMQLGFYSAPIDGDPVGAFPNAWASAGTGRITLVLVDLVYLLVFGAFAIVETSAQAMGPLVLLAALLLLALPKILVSATWVAGMSGAFLLHSRPAREVRTWAFFQR